MKIASLRNSNPKVIVQGMHPGIIQSVLDYDYILGRATPSVVAVIARGRKKERFHWGNYEIEVPLFNSLDSIDKELLRQTDAVINVQSARNVRNSVLEAMHLLPNLKVLSIFAENTPEIHSLELIDEAKKKEILIVGPSSVGVLLPGYLKLGAIGGTMFEQLIEARIKESGDVAIVTTSGGMVNELIRVVSGRGRGISFAIAMGGDRFPILEPAEALMLAQNDPQTKEIIYFGELGGTDEYKIAELVREKKLTKRVVVYIAGVVAELFTTPPQFGHAKALAQNEDESASAKKQALRSVGVIVCDGFDDIAASITPQPLQSTDTISDDIKTRRKSYFMSHISGEVDGNVQLLGNDLLSTVQANTVSSLVLSMMLGTQVDSKKLIDFIDFVLRLLVDHSPNVSGAVNTMIAARAGKDMVSSLTAGLLTIGPRFGGAVNDAAKAWLDGVDHNTTPKEFVDSLTRQSGIVPGIGHKKYRIDKPDPRVEALELFAPKNDSKYLDFALSIEAITTTKKTNLILNVDGAIAAVLLDLLSQELNYSPAQLRELVDIEFFNALFVISRSIGFTAHYLDQRRNDEGLFRLLDDDLSYFPSEN